MAGIIDSVRKKRNPYDPMVPMAAPTSVAKRKQKPAGQGPVPPQIQPADITEPPVEDAPVDPPPPPLPTDPLAAPTNGEPPVVDDPNSFTGVKPKQLGDGVTMPTKPAVVGPDINAQPYSNPEVVNDPNSAPAGKPVNTVAPLPPPPPPGSPGSLTNAAGETFDPPNPELRGDNLTMWYKQRGLIPPSNITGKGVLDSDGRIADGGTGTDFSKIGTEGTIGDGNTAWNPTTGIVDRIRGIDPQTVDSNGYTATTVDPATGYTAEGYTAATAPNAEGYTAQGYDAKTVDENLSGAVDRITSKDGIIMQRARANALGLANDRGILNSSMAVTAGQAAVLDKATDIGRGDIEVGMFNAQTVNEAKAFLANANNVAAQFLAAEKNQNGRFNAEQANAASQFSANAANQAKALLAEAQNTRSLFVAEQANLAARAAAEMDLAAKEFNATAYNQAQQRYVDALNAALAAQNDAENLARRDTAQINAQLTQAKMQGGVAQSVAAGNNATSVALGQMQRDAQMANLSEQMRQFGLTMDQRERESLRNLTAQQFNQFQQGLNAGMLTDMEPDARQNWLHNYMSVWAATGSLPFDINTNAFPPAGNPAPPGGDPPPGGNPIGR